MPPDRQSASPTQKVVELLYEKLTRDASSSLSAFLESTVIDCLPEPTRFGDVAEPWQRERNDAVVPAFEHIAGINGGYRGVMNFYFGLPKGSDKTSFCGRLLNWLLGFAPRKGLRAYVGAKDVEQAGTLRDCMKKEADLNGWFGRRLDFNTKVIKGEDNGAELHILTSDAKGTQGKNPDCIIYDEVCNWNDFDFFQSLYSGSGKRGDRTGRQRCVNFIITNAGYLNSWQWGIREMARINHGVSWHFSESPPGRTPAAWISDAVLEDQKRMLMPAEFRRLWHNVWVSEGEERGLFRPEDVDACVGPPTPPPANAAVFLSVDYGEVRDRTALATVWYDGRILHVVEMTVWQGSQYVPVKIEDVEAWVDRRLSEYPDAVVVLDRHQLVGTEQKLERRGVRVKRFQYNSGKSNYEMAEHLRTLLSNRRIRFASNAGLHPDGTTLADEFKSVIYKRMSYGYRIDHESTGHDDRVVTVGMAALEAVAETSPLPTPQKKKPPATSRPTADANNFGGFSADHLAARRWFR